MSPVGGVGINLAIQDAVAAANILARSCDTGAPRRSELQRVQRRREFPTKVTQWFQVQVQNRVLAPTLTHANDAERAFVLRVLNRWRWLRQWPARFVGIGVRPEHVTGKFSRGQIEICAGDQAPSRGRATSADGRRREKSAAPGSVNNAQLPAHRA